MAPMGSRVNIMVSSFWVFWAPSDSIIVSLGKYEILQTKHLMALNFEIEKICIWTGKTTFQNPDLMESVRAWNWSARLYRQFSPNQAKLAILHTWWIPWPYSKIFKKIFSEYPKHTLFFLFVGPVESFCNFWIIFWHTVYILQYILWVAFKHPTLN